MLYLKIIVLFGLTRLLLVQKKPFLVAGFYAGMSWIFFVFLGESFDLLGSILVLGISFLFSSIYFWLLWRLEENLIPYWTVTILGLLIGLV